MSNETPASIADELSRVLLYTVRPTGMTSMARTTLRLTIYHELCGVAARLKQMRGQQEITLSKVWSETDGILLSICRVYRLDPVTLNPHRYTLTTSVLSVLNMLVVIYPRQYVNLFEAQRQMSMLAYGSLDAQRRSNVRQPADWEDFAIPHDPIIYTFLSGVELCRLAVSDTTDLTT